MRKLVRIGQILRCGGRKAIAVNVSSRGDDQVGIVLSLHDLSTAGSPPEKQLARERQIFQLSVEEAETFNALWKKATGVAQVLSLQVGSGRYRR